MNDKNQKRGGMYFNNGQPYLSVTTILQIINKPQIVYWFGREVFRAMVVNPSLDERAALAAPYATSGKAKERGTTVHSIIEAFKNTGETIDTIPDEYRKYALAFYQFMKDHKVEIIEQEKTIYDEENKIAGTLDMYVKIGSKLMIVDAKTGKDLYDEVKLQNSAYAHMMRASGKQVDEIAALLLETGVDGLPTGKYKFATLEEDFDAFKACKDLYVWKNKESLLKTGYLKHELA
jgi:hypothetical protein